MERTVYRITLHGNFRCRSKAMEHLSFEQLMSVECNCLGVNADFFSRLYWVWSNYKEKMRVLLFSLALLASLKLFHTAPGRAPGRAPPAVSPETLKRESDIVTSLHEVNSMLLVTLICYIWFIVICTVYVATFSFQHAYSTIIHGTADRRISWLFQDSLWKGRS